MVASFTSLSNNATLVSVPIGLQKNELPKLSAEQNNVIKSRLDKTIYTYNANPCLSMSFTVQQGVIKNIEIHRAD